MPLLIRNLIREVDGNFSDNRTTEETWITAKRRLWPLLERLKGLSKFAIDYNQCCKTFYVAAWLASDLLCWYARVGLDLASLPYIREYPWNLSYWPSWDCSVLGTPSSSGILPTYSDSLLALNLILSCHHRVEQRLIPVCQQSNSSILSCSNFPSAATSSY